MAAFSSCGYYIGAELLGYVVILVDSPMYIAINSSYLIITVMRVLKLRRGQETKIT